jgi:hypothetical protein
MPVAGGAPRPLSDGAIAADWSPDGEQVAVIRWREGRNTLEYPMGTVVHTADAYLTDVRVAPDGRHIAFLDHPLIGDTGGGVAVMDAGGGHLRTLSAGWSDIAGLAWSRGDELVFTASRGTDARALYAVDLRGRERLVERDAGSLTLQDVARDGRVLLFSTQRRGAIGVIRAGDPRERDLSWLDHSAANALSEDATMLVFGESGQGGGPRYSIYIRRLDGGPAVRIGDGTALALSADKRFVLAMQTSPFRLVLLPTGTGEPRVLGEGLEYQPIPGAFLSDGRVVFVAREKGRPLRSFVQGLDGGPARPLTPEGRIAWIVTPDGRHVTAVAGGAAALVPVDGGPTVPLAGFGFGDFPLRWSADGRYLYLLRAGLPTPLVRLDPRTGARETVREIAPADPAGVNSITSILMTADLSTLVYSYQRTLSDLYVAEGLR